MQYKAMYICIVNHSYVCCLQLPKSVSIIFMLAITMHEAASNNFSMAVTMSRLQHIINDDALACQWMSLSCLFSAQVHMVPPVNVWTAPKTTNLEILSSWYLVPRKMGAGTKASLKMQHTSMQMHDPSRDPSQISQSLTEHGGLGTSRCALCTVWGLSGSVCI